MRLPPLSAGEVFPLRTKNETAVSFFRMSNKDELRKNPYSCADSVYPLFFVRSGYVDIMISLVIKTGYRNNYWSSSRDRNVLGQTHTGYFDDMLVYTSGSDVDSVGFPLRCLAI